MSKPPERGKTVRGRALDDRILNATLEIIRDRGPLGVNIEAVAAASGTAKTTIYRRFDDREDLLRAAIESATSDVVIPRELSTYETFRWLLHEARDMADNVVGRGAAASILLGDDPGSHELIREMIKVRASQLSELAQERVDAGDLKPGLDTGLVATILLGAVLGQIIRTGDVDDAWADSVLELLWPAFSA